MYQFMAKCQTTEDRLAARWFVVKLFKCVLDGESNIQMRGIGYPVHEESPVKVTSCCEFVSPKGTEDDNTGVSAIEFGEIGLKNTTLFDCSLTSCSQVLPICAKSSC
jgi:hypothetical protein